MVHSELYDYLTGVLNRKGLFELFGSLKEDQNVLFFDIDNFKTVNDMYGHDKGDETLVRFAKVLKDTLTDGSLVARLGGDEFVALIPGDKSKKEVSKIADNILLAVKDMKKEDRAFDIISASIGIVSNYKISEGLDGALSLSDKAMYYAKQQGKDTYVFYDDYEELINYESSIIKDSVAALYEDRFFILYHPTVHMQSSRIVNAEACCLMKTSDGNILGRNDFRPILSRNGFIDEIDFYIFNKVCLDIKYIRKSAGIKHRIGVQFSQSLLLDNQKLERLESIINEHGVSPEDFEINFDESIFGGRISPTNLKNGMCKLKDLGFSIALSRFGEDFSSVRYLKGLPISALKLDGEFIKENIKDEDGIRILTSIIKLGRGFKFSVIACKIDTNKEMYTLSECGCDAARGSFFTEKLALDEYIDFVLRINREDKDTVSYTFKGNLKSNNKFMDAEFIGEKIEYVDGISSKWGAVYLRGGKTQTNLIKFPNELFNNSSYTFSMWIKPSELQEWISALYIRYQGGFSSFMPNIPGGRCMYRIYEDAKLDVWHDAMTNALEVGKWSFVACTFDGVTSVARMYINGELMAVITDVPSLDSPKTVYLGGDVFQVSYNGAICAFQVNSIALDAEEIKNRYLSFKTKEDLITN